VDRFGEDDSIEFGKASFQVSVIGWIEGMGGSDAVPFLVTKHLCDSQSLFDYLCLFKLAELSAVLNQIIQLVCIVVG
jgi:hypothetical protein